MAAVKFFRRRTDPQLLADLRELTGTRTRVLAETVAETGHCAALPDRLVHGRTGQWRQVFWHEISHGGWNADTFELHWVLLDGGRGKVRLWEPGELPAVFHERVAASIAYQQRVPIEGTPEGVDISARRNLADPSAPLRWVASPVRGTRLGDPGVRQQVDDALELARAEFDV